MTEEPTIGGALAGIVIADFSRVLAGPYATMLLADFGAEVIKVERPPTGDDTRKWGPPFAANGQSTYFQSVNRNKHSVLLDLKTAAGLAGAQCLIARADVLVENFRVGGLDRFGLGYDDLKEAHPRLVYCSITGFGTAGGAGIPGYDLLVQALGGLMSISGPSVQEPTKTGVALVDVITGLHAVAGILAALRVRDETGQGQLVEVNLLSSLLSAMVNQSSAFVAAGVVPTALGNDHPSISPYGVYEADDGLFVIAVGNDKQFANLCDVLGISELATDARFTTNADRVANRGALREAIDLVLAAESRRHWQGLLTKRAVPCGPINDISQAFALAASLGLEPIVEVDTEARGTVRQVANPIKLSRTPPSYRLAPPEWPDD